MAPPKTNIELYSAGTPNGHKVSCTLEELGIDYKAHKIDFTKREQKEEWFLKINPNGRIPAIVDRTPSSAHQVFESGAIMLYLTEKYDPDHLVSFPHNSCEYWEMVQWIVFQQSGIGPMQGQADHFLRYAPTTIEYAIVRYQTETKRLYSVLEDRLRTQAKAGKGLWLVGGRYSIADLSSFCWANVAEWAGVQMQSFPCLQRWFETIEQREAVKSGSKVPIVSELKEAMSNKESQDYYMKKYSDLILTGQEAERIKYG